MAAIPHHIEYDPLSLRAFDFSKVNPPFTGSKNVTGWNVITWLESMIPCFAHIVLSFSGSRHRLRFQQPEVLRSEQPRFAVDQKKRKGPA